MYLRLLATGFSKRESVHVPRVLKFMVIRKEWDILRNSMHNHLFKISIIRQSLRSSLAKRNTQEREKELYV